MLVPCIQVQLKTLYQYDEKIKLQVSTKYFRNPTQTRLKRGQNKKAFQLLLKNYLFLIFYKTKLKIIPPFALVCKFILQNGLRKLLQKMIVPKTRVMQYLRFPPSSIYCKSFLRNSITIFYSPAKIQFRHHNNYI